VVFLTVHENTDYLREARAAGGLGYVIKSRMASDLATAINAANDGESFVSPF
jgi:DNA-binding NarL/FixJ family response regulator